MREHKHEVFARVYDTLTAVVQSMVVNAVAQGVLGGFGYWAIGALPFSMFLGFLTGDRVVSPAVRRRVHLGAGGRLPDDRGERRARRRACCCGACW